MSAKPKIAILGCGIAGAAIGQILSKSCDVNMMVRRQNEGSSYTNQKWKHSGLLYPDASLARRMWTAHHSMSTEWERPFVMKPEARFLCLHENTVQLMIDRWNSWGIQNWGLEPTRLSPHSFSQLGHIGRTNAVGGFRTPDCILDFPEMIRSLRHAAYENNAIISDNACAKKLIIKGGHVVGVEFRSGRKRDRIDCDHCIVAMGPWTADFLREQGMTLPLTLWKCVVLSYPLELVPCLTVVLDVRSGLATDTALVPFKGRTLVAESACEEVTEITDLSIDSLRVKQLRSELAKCFPRIASMTPSAHVCFKLEHRSFALAPDVGSHIYHADELGVGGLTVVLPGKASLAFELAVNTAQWVSSTFLGG